MPRKQTKTLVITFLIIDIISLGGFAGLLLFTNSLIIKSTVIEDEIKAVLRKQEASVLLKEDLVLSKVFQEKMASYMIPAGGTVDFIKTIETLVSKSGLQAEIKTVANEANVKTNPIGAELLKVNMNMTGEWNSIQFFIKSLENYPYKIDINKLSLNKFSNTSVKGKSITQWSGNIEFTIVKIKDVK